MACLFQRLEISKSIIEAHGGKLTVRSKFGEGAVFTIELPMTIHEISSRPSPQKPDGF